MYNHIWYCPKTDELWFWHYSDRDELPYPADDLVYIGPA